MDTNCISCCCCFLWCCWSCIMWCCFLWYFRFWWFWIKLLHLIVVATQVWWMMRNRPNHHIHDELPPYFWQDRKNWKHTDRIEKIHRKPLRLHYAFKEPPGWKYLPADLQIFLINTQHAANPLWIYYDGYHINPLVQWLSHRWCLFQSTW